MRRFVPGRFTACPGTDFAWETSGVECASPLEASVYMGVFSPG